MIFRVKNYSEFFIWICITIYFSLIPLASIITTDSGAGKYLLLLPILISFIIKLINSNFKFSIAFSYDVLYLLLFALFILFSSLWALEPKYSISKGIDAIEVLLVMLVIKTVLPKDQSVYNLLISIMMGSYFIVLFAVLKYGWAYVINTISSETRLVSTLINANVVGMSAAFAILISFYLSIFEKQFYSLVFALPTFFVLVSSGSRKALLILFFGLISLIILKNIDNRKNLKNIAKAIIILALTLIISYQILKLPVFNGVHERFIGMINGFFNKGDVDHSTSIRLRMIKIGMSIFHDHPILGIGMDNAKIFTESEFWIKNYYLHNNYVELLADGGLVGFSIYYSIYIYLLVIFWKYRDFNSGEFDIVFVMLVLRLVLDYGMVSYETKSTYIYLLLFVLIENTINKDGLKLKELID